MATDESKQLKRNVTLNKWWNWSYCTKMALSSSWNHVVIAQSVRASERVSRCGFKFHSRWLSIGSSQNPSVVNTTCISWFSNTHVITHRKLWLNKRGYWRLQTAKMKRSTEEIMKLECLCNVVCECELNTGSDSSVGSSKLTGFKSHRFKSCSCQISMANYRESVSGQYHVHELIPLHSCYYLQKISIK